VARGTMVALETIPYGDRRLRDVIDRETHGIRLGVRGKPRTLAARVSEIAEIKIGRRGGIAGRKAFAGMEASKWNRANSRRIERISSVEKGAGHKMSHRDTEGTEKSNTQVFAFSVSAVSRRLNPCVSSQS